MFGRFRDTFPDDGSGRPFCATKYCQFKRVDPAEVIDRDWVLKRVKDRSDRVGGTVDLLQVHWQYVSHPKSPTKR